MKSNIFGIDEVGRGPFAGPVNICVFGFVDKSGDNFTKDFLVEKYNLPIRDSKKLTEKQRNKWSEILHEMRREGSCVFAIGQSKSDVVDKKGINFAISSAIENAMQDLGVKFDDKIYLDGGLHLDKKYVNQETVIKGDENILQISFASIVAKVYRDNLMNELDKKFPGYGLAKNKGYGTAEHISAIREKGITPIHRVSYLKNI